MEERERDENNQNKIGWKIKLNEYICFKNRIKWKRLKGAIYGIHRRKSDEKLQKMQKNSKIHRKMKKKNGENHETTDKLENKSFQEIRII